MITILDSSDNTPAPETVHIELGTTVSLTLVTDRPAQPGTFEVTVIPLKSSGTFGQPNNIEISGIRTGDLFNPTAYFTIKNVNAPTGTVYRVYFLVKLLMESFSTNVDIVSI